MAMHKHWPALAVVILGCRPDNSAPVSRASPSVASELRRDGGTDGATRNPRESIPTNARLLFRGTTQGRGAEPPIQQYVTRPLRDPWTGTGEARIEVPIGDGPVNGTVSVGDLRFTVRGFRTGRRVRATLDQQWTASGVSDGAAIDGSTQPPEDLFRGTLDAEIHDSTLHGTWEISAQAGVRRRSGTLEAQR